MPKELKRLSVSNYFSPPKTIFHTQQQVVLLISELDMRQSTRNSCNTKEPNNMPEKNILTIRTYKKIISCLEWSP
jgi:hypothetical protein